MTDRLLEELLGTAASDAPVECGSNVFDLLSQPLSIWGDVDDRSGFCIPAVPTECVRLNAESPADDLLLRASPLFAREEEKEEDALLLAASQQYEKRCGPLMSSED